VPYQPLRVVMGERKLAPTYRIFNDAAPSLHLRTRDPEAVLAELFDRGRRHVFTEGGPTLAAALLRAGLVDEIVGYVAPTLLGEGRTMVGDLGIATIADALAFELAEAVVVGEGADANLRLRMIPRHRHDSDRED